MLGGFSIFAFFPRLAHFNLADGSQVHISVCGKFDFGGIYFGGSLIHPPIHQILFSANTIYMEFFYTAFNLMMRKNCKIKNHCNFVRMYALLVFNNRVYMYI